MLIRARLSSIRDNKLQDYAVRFLFGGAVCVVAGIVSNRFGPAMGGLFLAFPAIFPASATLLESHEQTRRRCAGIENSVRGRVVAGVDAAGAAIGAWALAGFAAVGWILLARWPAWAVFPLATSVWAVLAIGLWILRKRHIFRR